MLLCKKSKPKKFKIKHLEVIWTGESLVNITRGEMVGYLLAEISNLKGALWLKSNSKEGHN